MFRALLFVVAAGLLACGVPAHAVRLQYDLPPYTDSAGSWHELELPMRDGVKLHTRWMIPAGMEKAPVVVVRNPYNYAGLGIDVQCSVYVRYGIGCVVQDTRGRLESQGEWEPLIHEGDDGEDTLNWVAAQPWSGEIALWGVSYLAATALASTRNPPAKLKTMVLEVFGVDLRQTMYERGLFHHELITAWTSFMPTREVPSLGHAEEVYRAALSTRPFIDADEKAIGHKLPFFRQWLQSMGPDDGVWATAQPKEFYSVPERVKVPVLYIEGFDDPFLKAGLDTYARLASRKDSTLALLPVNHTGFQSGAVQVDVDSLGMYTWTLSIPWLLHQLKGAPLPYETGVVKSWPRGMKEPVTRPEWPGPVASKKLALDPRVAQRWPCDQRALLEEEPAAGRVEYRYDPKHPWKSEGGARGLAYVIVNGVTPGPTRQTWECRDDVVRFVTSDLAEPLHLLGTSKVRLKVRSSAPDTAFIAKLVDIDEKGRAFHVVDGGATLHWPTEETRAPLKYAPGDERDVELDLFPTEWVLPKGHRLGLWISSSNFPMFSLHLNTEEPWYQASVFHLADQQIELGGSALELSVAP
ncbi:MAG: CocE/NonD family hydrolase [Myxococcaceae bacterium]